MNNMNSHLDSSPFEGGRWSRLWAQFPPWELLVKPGMALRWISMAPKFGKKKVSLNSTPSKSTYVLYLSVCLQVYIYIYIFIYIYIYTCLYIYKKFINTFLVHLTIFAHLFAHLIPGSQSWNTIPGLSQSSAVPSRSFHQVGYPSFAASIVELNLILSSSLGLTVRHVDNVKMFLLGNWTIWTYFHLFFIIQCWFWGRFQDSSLVCSILLLWFPSVPRLSIHTSLQLVDRFCQSQHLHRTQDPCDMLFKSCYWKCFIKDSSLPITPWKACMKNQDVARPVSHTVKHLSAQSWPFHLQFL